jgi:Carbohydrate binding domain (family 11)
VTAARWRRRALLGLALAAGLFSARTALWRPYAVVGDAPPGPRAVGVVHVHTTLSDGGGTPEDVARAARAAGLQFVVLTDHNHLDAKAFEGYHDGVLVIVGTEISTTAGHLLGLGIPDPVYRFSGDAADALDDVRALGGSAYAAHPLSPREDFRWTGWDLPGQWGIELLNGDSQWRAAGWGRLLRAAALYPLNARYALLGSVTPPRETLARWDALLAQRHVTGIAGADAHSRVALSKRFAPRFPSYESVFALARNHVLLDAPLTGEAAADTRAILDALRRGQVYVGLDALADASGFTFGASTGAGMGQTAPPSPSLSLRAGGRMPRGTRIVILRDGRSVAEGVGSVNVGAAAPGVYRAEAYVPGWDVPWVLTNPVEVFDATAATARESRAAWPSTPPVPGAVETIDAFDGRTAFEAGFDAASAQNKDVIDPHADPKGGGAARIAFRLGVPSDGHPDVFCALVDGTRRDLTGKQGLVLSLKADGVYRIWIQVRDANPASKDEQTEWWFASLRTSTEWQRVAVPFARLRSINPNTDGKLDLDQVRALVFVLDKGSLKPGTAGTIWLDDLGTY